MDIPNTMSREELARTRQQADAVNAKLRRRDGSEKGEMGKDAFLKLLITELKHQDPTQPMQDREFISQMAQFSALEQMTNVSKSMEALNKSARSSEAYSLLGKRVEAFNPATGMAVEGEVSRIFYRENDIRLMVNGTELGLSDIHSVLPPREKTVSNPTVELPGANPAQEAPVFNTQGAGPGGIRAFESDGGAAVKAYEHNQ